MSMAVYSPSSDVRLSFCGNHRIRNLDLFVPKSFVRVAKSKEKVNENLYNYDLRNSGISGHLVPQQLEGSRMRNTRPSEPAPKLKLIRTLLIDNYDSYTYNIYQDLSVINGLPPVVIRNDEWTWKDFYHYLYEEKAFDNIVISPGPGSPTCPEDIGICLRLLRECGDIPILGVCLGHQALGLAHGAQVVHASEPVHGRLSDLEHNGCILFDDIPSGNSEFKVVRYHSLVLDPESLPEELIPIAWTSSSDTLPFLVANGSVFPSDPFDRAKKTSSGPQLNNMTNGKGCSLVHSVEMRSEKVIMGVMHCKRPHYGLQFHPESVATHYGRKIFSNFSKITKDYWSGLRSSPIRERSDHYGSELLKSCMQVPDIGGMLQCSRRCQHPMHRTEKENHVDFQDVPNLTQPCKVIKSLKLKWKKLELMASQVGGTGSIFQELFGNNKADNTFWLDSASTEKGRARFSFMGGKGSSLWKQITFRLSDQSDKSCESGGYLSIRDSEGNFQNTFITEGFFEYLNQDLQSFSYDPKDYEGLPFEFCGGYVGYIGYELKIECGVPLNHHKSRAPDACFFFADNLIVIDHHTDDIYLLAIHDDVTDSIPWFDVVEQKLLNLTSCPMETSFSQVSQHSANSEWKSAFVAEKTKEQYTNDISKCQNFIKDGESYELCFTSQMRKDVEDVDPLKLYLLLREKNPAPYAAWLNFSEENLSVCCSSPERFLRLNKDGILEAKPIKGTIARGATQEEDELLKLQLQYSEKDQAENLMIVDLLRNDLGRVCEPGSVDVPHLMEVESYATVHTMVSTIRGNKRSDVSPVDCVKSAFPGGSMTGAPKLRSMELLDALESSARGIYSGCIGFFSYNQTFDLNIVIRTVVIHEGEASIGAGGAITALSNSHDEYEEMILKTRAPANAVIECERYSK